MIKVLEFESDEDVLLTSVERAFKNFFISYSKSINTAYNRTGALLQYKFKRKEVSNDDYFSWLIYYIHANPVKSGFAKNLEDWPYSSYKEIIAKNNSLIKSQDILDWYGGEKEFVDFHQKNLGGSLSERDEFRLDFDF